MINRIQSLSNYIYHFLSSILTKLVNRSLAGNAKKAEGAVLMGINYEKMMGNMRCYAVQENAEAFDTPLPQILASSRALEGVQRCMADGLARKRPLPLEPDG